MWSRMIRSRSSSGSVWRVAGVRGVAGWAVRSGARAVAVAVAVAVIIPTWSWARGPVVMRVALERAPVVTASARLACRPAGILGYLPASIAPDAGRAARRHTTWRRTF